MQEKEEGRCHLQMRLRTNTDDLTHTRKPVFECDCTECGCMSGKAFPIPSLPKVLIWCALASTGSLIAIPLQHAWTWHPICVHYACGSCLGSLCFLPAWGLCHVCRLGQAMESVGSPAWNWLVTLLTWLAQLQSSLTQQPLSSWIRMLFSTGIRDCLAMKQLKTHCSWKALSVNLQYLS